MANSVQEFTKARIKYERALAARARLDAVIQVEIAKADKDVERWLDVAISHAEEAGYCRACFKPLNQGSHNGPDHIVWAGVTDQEGDRQT